MMWGIGRQFPRMARASPLNFLLNKPNVTVEELMDEDELMLEIKEDNEKLIQFLSQDAVLDRLLSIVVAGRSTKAPTGAEGSDIDSATSSSSRDELAAKEQADGVRDDEVSVIGYDDAEPDGRRMKLAFTACEILSADRAFLAAAIKKVPESIVRFWKFIAAPGPLDPIQSSYFAKISEILFHNQTELMIGLFKTIDGVVGNMLRHVDSPVIMDLLLKIISLDREDVGRGIVNWLQSQNMIPVLLSYLSPGQDENKQTAAGDYLKAIITISANATPQDQSAIGPNELTRQLVSEPCVQQLIKDMLAGGNPLTVGVGIVIEVIRKNNSDYDTVDRTGPVPRTTDPIYLGTLLRCFADRIPDFMRILETAPKVVDENGVTTSRPKRLRSAAGDEFEPLGFARFKTCELMAELLHCSNMKLLNTKGAAAEIGRRDTERERLRREGGDQAEGPMSAVDIDLDLAIEEYCNAISRSGPVAALVPDSESPLKSGDEPEVETETKAGSSVETGDVGEAESRDQGVHSPTSSKLSEIVGSLDLGDTDETGDRHPDVREAVRLSNPTVADINPAQERNEDDDENGGLHPGGLAVVHRSNPEEDEDEDDDDDEDDDEDDDDDDEDDGEAEPRPAYEVDEDGLPIVGDILKIMFVEHRVVSTIIDFLFRFPWNNFLHNVVFDVIQQIFTGTMESGYNSSLVVDVFGPGKLIERIIGGQASSDQAEADTGVRMGYMGHLTLISAEVIKFAETYNPESLPTPVGEKVVSADWVAYTESAFMETRERDNAILGGIRPDTNGTFQTATMGLGPSESDPDGPDDMNSDKAFPALLDLSGLTFSVSDGFGRADGD